MNDFPLFPTEQEKQSRYFRSKAKQNEVIGLSIGYNRDELDALLARGLGLEQLRELLIRLARPLLRKSASIAYGGFWKESPDDDNFTYTLLKLIGGELEDNSIGGPDTNHLIGALYNHVAWPNYLDITAAIEARWVNCCRIIRITQQMAGFHSSECVPDEEYSFEKKSDRFVFNAAATLSVMRQLMMRDLYIGVPDPAAEIAPATTSRVLFSGLVASYGGFAPGIFEEALWAFECRRPLFILGGFGGAAEILAQAILCREPARPVELTENWHLSRNAKAARLSRIELRRPQGRVRIRSGGKEDWFVTNVFSTGQLLERLYEHIVEARSDLKAKLPTNLTGDETIELMRTRNISTAVKLVLKGLGAHSRSDL